MEPLIKDVEFKMADFSNDDVISLDGLIGDDAIMPQGDSGSDEPPAEHSPSSSPPPATYGKNSDIEGLLASEDPNFAVSMQELQAQGGVAAGGIEIDSLDLEQLKKEKMPGRIRLFLEWVLAPINARLGEGHTVWTRIAQIPPLVVSSIRSLLHLVKDLSIATLTWVNAEVKSFLALPRKAKLTLFVALALGALAVVTLKVSIGQRNNIQFRKVFFRSFAEVADGRFEYDRDEPMENFTDPLHHPEHMMLLDKFVVNLRPPRDGSANPMGLFEFYLEASNQDSAVEIKDRQGEIRDIIARSLEQMSYSDLVSVPGKEKMKVVLRKNVNTILTRGQIRRVFIKTIVVKP
jgi:flagellar basal body-associated protein FliL